MEIKIGVRDIGRELSVETDQSAEQLETELRAVLASGDGVWAVQATKGRRVLLPGRAIGYVELGSEHTRPVGFGFGDSSSD